TASEPEAKARSVAIVGSVVPIVIVVVGITYPSANAIAMAPPASPISCLFDVRCGRNARFQFVARYRSRLSRWWQETCDDQTDCTQAEVFKPHDVLLCCAVRTPDAQRTG